MTIEQLSLFNCYSVNLTAKNMNNLKSSNARGFFDPVSLGLHIPQSFTSEDLYSDDLDLLDKGTLIHELTHYLQFFGTCFGFFYQFQSDL